MRIASRIRLGFFWTFGPLDRSSSYDFRSQLYNSIKISLPRHACKKILRFNRISYEYSSAIRNHNSQLSACKK
jgi:hypothetical protein